MSMSEGEYLDSLIEEYKSLFTEVVSTDPQTRDVDAAAFRSLLASADWTTSGADELLRLVDEYGAFVLRNAFAIAVALGKEDGTRGF